ncbi:MAG: transcriptional repressor LexA [Oscillospiraceae bacterium]|nr:transcriptional repressor LexA [Oscillospiraceae bacterium]
MPRTSNKAAEIYTFLQDFFAEHGYSPSIREICEGVGLRSTASVHYHLEALKKQGRIQFASEKKRAITLPMALPHQVPILGVVTAGYPILAVENIEGYLPWDGEEDCFALRVRGDSMIGAGILDGDRVVVHSQPTADSGRIVVALLGDEATVKRLSIGADGVWLLPENPNYLPIDGREATLLGVVRAVIRIY